MKTNSLISSGGGYSLGLIVVILLLLGANLLAGSVRIPADVVWDVLCGRTVERESWRFIILESRIPQGITALLCGAALAVSGLMLQTVFGNPLAGPSILGIDAGASLGVAIIMLLGGGSITAGAFGFSGFLAVIAGALTGAFLVMMALLFFSAFTRSNLMLLIIGIMLGYMTSSVISLLNFFSTAEGVHSYVIWGLGNFSGVSSEQLPFFVSAIGVGLFLAVMLIKPLNALLLGNRYAENLGINVRLTRNLLLIATGLLTAVTTAFCGPIAFIGLAVPHIARLMLGTSNHNALVPVTLLLGGAIALLCNLISILPGESGILPLNAITPVLGAPVIIYIIVNQRKIQYFN